MTHRLIKGYHHHLSMTFTSHSAKEETGNWMNHWWSFKRLTLISLWLRTAANGEELWTAASLSVGSRFERAEISSQSLGTEHLTSRGDSLRLSHRRVLAVSQAVLKQRCHFHFNMQRTLKGMLIWAFIKMNSHPWLFLVRVCQVHPSSAGQLQVGARYGS